MTINMAGPPVEVTVTGESMRLEVDLWCRLEIATWIRSNGGQADILKDENAMNVVTPAGIRTARLGDRIVRRTDGTFTVRRGNR